MRRAFILIAAALMLSACCGRNCPAEVAVIPQPQVVETGRSTVVLRAGEYDVVRSLDSTMRASSYSLDIDKKGVRICAGDEAGLFYAEQTLRQLVPADSAEVTLNRTHIEDWPEFGYRGMMLDVARHFFSVEDVKTVLDIMALHKLNYLHWHLTDDQGWRLEINAYPQLTKVGSMRRRTIIGKDPNGEYDENTPFDETPYGGYYTQDQVREIVEYAAQRHITVVPEIEFPGHAVAALASYPWLSCTGEQYRVRETWDIDDRVYCIGKESTFRFMENVLSEVIDLFPSPYIHIGGDECPKERWKECERCQAKIAALGLKDIEGHSKEEQLQSWFMGEVAKEIKARGRKMLGWDEILDGTPSKDITVIAWTSQKASIRSAKEGHKTVVAPITNFYFSNPRINQITGIPSIKRVYDVNPAFADLSDSEKANVIGAEGCIWTEWVPDTKKLEWELLPRLAALAEVQWTNQEQREFGSFAERLLHMHDIYRKMNLNYKEDIEKAILTDGNAAK